MSEPMTQWLVAGRHHHIEMGHVEADVPEARFPSQNGWVNLTWEKRLLWIEDGRIVPAPEDES